MARRHFHARAERSKHGIRYEFRRRGQGIVVGFTAEQWKELKSAYLAMLDEPAVLQVSDELSWMYGVI